MGTADSVSEWRVAADVWLGRESVGVAVGLIRLQRAAPTQLHSLALRPL
jgi:hypothetical protein